MTVVIADHEEVDHDWSLYAAVLPVVGAAIALALHFLLPGPTPFHLNGDTGRLAVVSYVATGGIAFGFVIVRVGLLLSLALAMVARLTVADVVCSSSRSSRRHDGEDWRLLCALLTVTVARAAVPGMARRDQWRSLCGGTWPRVEQRCPVVRGVDLRRHRARAHLVARRAIRTDRADFPSRPARQVVVIRDAGRLRLRRRGRLAARPRAGARNALARRDDGTVGARASAGGGLIAFLAALPFAGLTPLWSTTTSTTPILLSCIIGALILSSAVISDTTDALRWAAMALEAAILPLGLIAAVSTRSRITRYGVTTDRLSALVFTDLGYVYGIAYLTALIANRAGWQTVVRRASLCLALSVCGIALFLSTPLVRFGARDTRSAGPPRRRAHTGRQVRVDGTALRVRADGASGGRATDAKRAHAADSIRRGDHADGRRVLACAGESDARGERKIP